ncbi:MAG: prepilin-type N-terminal cleavage/methylation domain-containing protein [Chromatiales bacterium]|nr:prepilin-type N-terminal cleavage/methylation domain-containing protein [Chromatiales bacterium]
MGITRVHGLKRRAHGFTLVELLVVMAIAAVVMTAVPTLFSAAFPGLEMKSAARRTVATLRLARESAIRRGEETAVLVDLEQHRLTLAGYRALSLPDRLSLRLDAAGQRTDRRAARRSSASSPTAVRPAGVSCWRTAGMAIRSA